MSAYDRGGPQPTANDQQNALCAFGARANQVPGGSRLGNFPQAFSHLALIEAATRMIVPELAHF
jgi:GH15 family glucan-1,4-alpha-glucosidase